MPPRRAFLLLPALLLAGCTNPLGSLDTGHCHAQHNQELDTRGDPWSYQKTPPREANGISRVYAWGLSRTGGCVSDVHLQAHVSLATNTTACGGVELAQTSLYGDVWFDGNGREVAPEPLQHGDTREWLYDQTFSYNATAPGDQPQTWNATFELAVPHDALALAPHVDDCVHRALRIVDALGTDRDFKPWRWAPAHTLQPTAK